MVVFMVIYHAAKDKITFNKSKSTEMSDWQGTFFSSHRQNLEHNIWITFQIQHLPPEKRSTSCTRHHFFFQGNVTWFHSRYNYIFDLQNKNAGFYLIKDESLGILQ